MRSVVCIVLLGVLALAVHAGEAEAKTGSLTVVVRDAEGKAIADAVVEIWDDEEVWGLATDERGRAGLGALPAGRYGLSVSARGYTAVERHGIVVDAGLEERLELTLEPGIPFAGLVLGPDDEPVASVYVEIRRGGTFEGYAETFADPTPYARVFTDEAGRFFVGGIPPGRVATVVVQAEAYEETRVCVRAVGDAVRPHPLVIRLVKGGEVFGTVLDAAGKPVADAVIYVVPAENDQLRRNPRIRGWSTDGSSFAAWTARSDGRGAYRVAGLPLDESYVALADAAGHARSAWSEPFRPTTDQNAGRFDLSLHRPATLRVHVRAPEGRTTPEFRAQLGGHMSGLDAEPGGAEGVVSFDRLWPDTFDLSVDARGYLPYRASVTVAEGETKEVEVRLDAGVAIEGRVLDEAGRGVAGVRVEAERKEDDEGEGWHDLVAGRAETDAEGRFTLAGLRPGRHALSAGKRGFDLLEDVEVTAPAKDVVLEGAHLGVLLVRFTTPEGEAVTYSDMLWRWKPDGSGGGSAEEAEEGVFRLIGFRGKERLTFDFDGYVRVEREVEVPPGKTVDLGTIRLEVGLTLAGRVVDPAGVPVVDAVVDHARYTEATADADGRFTLPHLPAGEIEVTVDAEGFLETEARVEVTDGGAPVELVLSRGTLLAGVVTDEAGEPLADHWFRVERRDEAGAWHEDDYFSTDDDGAYEIRVRTGPCRIAFYAERDAPPVVLASLDGREGETKRLDLVLPVTPADGTTKR